MRSVGTMLAATVVAAMTLSGCNGGGNGVSSPTAAAPTGTTGTTGTVVPVGDCPVGMWRSTQIAATGTAAGITGELSGGEGVVVEIDQDGQVNADFADMEPVTYTAEVAGAQVRGDYVYRGTINGTVSPISPTASASDAITASGTSGQWDPVGQVGWNDLRITIRLTDPVSVTVADGAQISDVTGEQTTRAGGTVDLQPLLREGTYRCDSDTLVITPGGRGPAITWTLTSY